MCLVIRIPGRGVGKRPSLTAHLPVSYVEDAVSQSNKEGEASVKVGVA